MYSVLFHRVDDNNTVTRTFDTLSEAVDFALALWDSGTGEPHRITGPNNIVLWSHIEDGIEELKALIRDNGSGVGGVESLSRYGDSGISQEVLEMLTFKAQMVVSDAIAGALARENVHVSAERVFGGLAVKLVAHIYGKHRRRVDITYPLTWKDAILDALASSRLPAFIRKRLPEAQYRRVVIDVAEIYPTLPVLANNAPHVVIPRYDAFTMHRNAAMDEEEQE